MSYVLVVLIYKVFIFQRKNNICQVTVLRPLYFAYYVICLVCLFLNGKTMLMNVFNTNYISCFISILVLKFKNKY